MNTRTTLEEPAASPRAEHARSPAVIRVVEMVGVSTEGWEDAVRQAVARASRTVRHLTGIDVVRRSGVVRDGRIAEYHAAVKAAFIVEPAGAAGGGATSGAAATPADDNFGIWGSASDIQ
ncbi:dodecin family protein [Aquisphaera giovannonii]|nr:dodecin family protein [Aquisphaera giovannonii]